MTHTYQDTDVPDQGSTVLFNLFPHDFQGRVRCLPGWTFPAIVIANSDSPVPNPPSPGCLHLFVLIPPGLRDDPAGVYRHVEGATVPSFSSGPLALSNVPPGVGDLEWHRV